jgi:hypothetical protein
MAEQTQPQGEGGASPKHESLMEKLADKLHVGGGKADSSSSDSDSDERPRPSAPPADELKQPSFSDAAATAAAEAKAKVFRLFGREQPIHKALGGGKRMALFPTLPMLLAIRLEISRSDLGGPRCSGCGLLDLTAGVRFMECAS